MLHKSAKKLLEVVHKISKENERQEYSITSFKAALSMNFGFREPDINSRFNFLRSIGIIDILKTATSNSDGKLILKKDKLEEIMEVHGLVEARNRIRSTDDKVDGQSDD